MAKKKADKLELYARENDTIYDVSKYRQIVSIFNLSTKIVTELAKLQQLPHEVFVESDDLCSLNEMVFGINRHRNIPLCMSNQRNAPVIILIRDIKDKFEEIEETKQ